MSDDSRSIIGIVGATGAVGREALTILRERGVAPSSIRAFGSERSCGRELAFGPDLIVVEPMETGRLHGCAELLFCASADVALSHVPAAVSAGCTVVDNSSAFRMNARVPLVVPEVNGSLLRSDTRLVANPNCSTVLLLMALSPLLELGELRQVTVSTYQAISGAGAAALDELRDQTAAVLRGEPARPVVFPEPCAFNVFPHESDIDENGLNGEENKIIAESRRILGLPALPIFPTCARVPVERAHSQSIVAEFERAPDQHAIHDALASAAGVRVMKGPTEMPTPLRASHGNEVLVGRIRVDKTSHRVGLWACADQLRKGAALNAIQILEDLRSLQPSAEKDVIGLPPHPQGDPHDSVRPSAPARPGACRRLAGR